MQHQLRIPTMRRFCFCFVPVQRIVAAVDGSTRAPSLQPLQRRISATLPASARQRRRNSAALRRAPRPATLAYRAWSQRKTSDSRASSSARVDDLPGDQLASEARAGRLPEQPPSCAGRSSGSRAGTRAPRQRYTCRWVRLQDGGGRREQLGERLRPQYGRGRGRRSPTRGRSAARRPATLRRRRATGRPPRPCPMRSGGGARGVDVREHHVHRPRAPAQCGPSWRRAPGRKRPRPSAGGRGRRRGRPPRAMARWRQVSLTTKGEAGRRDPALFSCRTQYPRRSHSARSKFAAAGQHLWPAPLPRPAPIPRTTGMIWQLPGAVAAQAAQRRGVANTTRGLTEDVGGIFPGRPASIS